MLVSKRYILNVRYLKRRVKPPFNKKLNQIKASSRIVVEHINARIKAFQIFTQKYRNRRKKFGLRLNLICALINADRAIN